MCRNSEGYVEAVQMSWIVIICTISDSGIWVGDSDFCIMDSYFFAGTIFHENLPNSH